jgi:hypothetical protein
LTGYHIFKKSYTTKLLPFKQNITATTFNVKILDWTESISGKIKTESNIRMKLKKIIRFKWLLYVGRGGKTM